HSGEHLSRGERGGRDLGGRGPAEREQIAVRDGALLRRGGGDAAGGGEGKAQGGAHTSIPRRVGHGRQRIGAPQGGEILAVETLEAVEFPLHGRPKGRVAGE